MESGELFLFNSPVLILVSVTMVPFSATKTSMITANSRWYAECRLAQEAAQLAYQHIQKSHDLNISYKGRVDLVTQVDLESETIIRKVLSQARPDIPILAEELGGEQRDTQWIIDPLDGTTNFVHGFPGYAVSIGLMVENTIRVGCILDASQGALYTATQGGGAYCNDEPIQVSTTTTLEQSLLLTGFPYDRQKRAHEYLGLVERFMIRAQGIRRAGSAALDLAHIASGRAEGYWEYGLSPWDIAAGTLLVSEAGGQVTDMLGGPLDIYVPRLLVSNAQIHQDMIHIIHQHTALLTHKKA